LDKPRLTVREITLLLGVKPESVRSWREAGLLPNTIKRNARLYLYARDDLVRLLRARVPYRADRNDVDNVPTHARLANLRPDGPLDNRVQIIVDLGSAGCTPTGIANYLGLSVATVHRVLRTAP
jgi:DNA-binding NarL/FixJ family response regulator